jgi:hypothetical protein
MKLSKPFCRLPLRFDAERLRYEVTTLPAEAWARHPSGYAGNSALRLITTGGAENDDVAGEMKPTAALARCPYIQQVLGSFGVVWSRSRLMKLAPRSEVPAHCDVNYHWHDRVRIHIPVITFPEVRFNCGGQTVNMAAGEAWIFDNWRPHSVENPTDHDRIHLVADTMGNEAFWTMAQRGQWENFDSAPATAPTLVPYRSVMPPPLLTEKFNAPTVMPPAELEGLVNSLCADLALPNDTPEARAVVVQVVQMLRGFCSEWRQLWSLFGDGVTGWPHYARLRQLLRDRLATITMPLHLRSNRVPLTKALNAGVVQHLLNPPGAEIVREVEYTDQPSAAETAPAPKPAAPRRVELPRPVFIVAAPRSGSTLLFETLAQSGELCNLGGEAHALIEQFDELRPNGGVDSNRLTAAQLTPAIGQAIREGITRRLRHAAGQPPPDGARVRLLEKTPKNALRIPFFKALFPDALFVFLWRDPRENLGSIMEAWRSGGFVTYPALDGRAAPWSLLLPPGWRELRDRPLEEIAAWQWRVTNEVILDDLAQLPASDWAPVHYADFIADPDREIRRLAGFAGVPFDESLRARVQGPLPFSRHTLTAPKEDKWRKHEADILRVLPSLEPMWARLRALSPAPEPVAERA